MLFLGGNGPMPYSRTSLARMPEAPELPAAFYPARAETAPGWWSAPNWPGVWGLNFATLGIAETKPLGVGCTGSGEFMCLVASERAPLCGLLYAAGDSTTYAESGRPIAAGSSVEVPGIPPLQGLLFAHYAGTRGVPDRAGFSCGPQIFPRCRYEGSLTEADRAAYNEHDAWFVLWGAFGRGEVNGRRYVQVLWIPVPTGGATAAGSK